MSLTVSNAIVTDIKYLCVFLFLTIIKLEPEHRGNKNRMLQRKAQMSEKTAHCRMFLFEINKVLNALSVKYVISIMTTQTSFLKTLIKVLFLSDVL